MDTIQAFLYSPLVYPLYLTAILEIVIVVASIVTAKREGIYDPSRIADAVGKYLGPWLGLVALAFLTWAVGDSGDVLNLESGVVGALYIGTYTLSIRRDLDKLVTLYRGQPELHEPIDLGR